MPTSRRYLHQKGTTVMLTLSKSKYISGLQCPKILWLDSNRPELRDDSDKQKTFERGTFVGDLARGYFGEYHLIDFDKGIADMLKQTKSLISENAETICEASFSKANLFCSVDILHLENGKYDIVEVKSSTSVTDTYINDTAFQYHVLKESGVNLGNAYILHIDNTYVRKDELDIHGLFKLEDVTEKVMELLPDIPENINRIREEADVPEEPGTAISSRCVHPYECPYRNYCHRDVPENSVFDVARLSKDKAYALYEDGIITFEDILKSRAVLNAKQMRQVRSTVLDEEPTVDVEAIREFLDTLTYPMYFLDFETYQEAVPQFDDAKPYQQIPFQYSLHIRESRDSEEKHLEFLGTEGTDPRRALAERLCEDIPMNVCSLAYNMGFEKARIREMADIFPDLKDHLLNIAENMKDLMIPFQKQYYYSKALKGSYSIKYVLPAMCEGDEELNYKALDQIHNGSEAMNAFTEMVLLSEEERLKTRKNLLAYCRLDTLAMVRILDRLYEFTE